MRYRAIGLLASAVFFCGSECKASLLAYEPFNYTSGQNLLGQSNPSTGTNWQRAATTATQTGLTVATGNLTPPSPLQPAIGNSLSIAGIGNNNGGSDRLAFAPAATPLLVTSGTVYYSLTMKVTETTGSNTTNGGFFTGLNNTGDAATTGNPSVVGARIQMRQNAGDPTNKYDLEIDSNRGATQADSNWSVAGPFNVGDTLFLVAAYSLDTHTSSLWINPDTSTFGAGSAPTATETDTTDGTAITTIGSIIARQSPAPFVTMDELRVGTSWADVTTVPEPASLGILTLLGAGLLARRRQV